MRQDLNNKVNGKEVYDASQLIEENLTEEEAAFEERRRLWSQSSIFKSAFPEFYEASPRRIQGNEMFLCHNNHLIKESYISDVDGEEKVELIRKLWHTDTALPPEEMETVLKNHLNKIDIKAVFIRGQRYVKMVHTLLFIKRDIALWKAL